MLNEEVQSMVEEDKTGKLIVDLIKRAVFGSPSEQEAERLKLILSHPKFLEHQIPVCEDVALQSAHVVTLEAVRTRPKERSKSATQRASLSAPLVVNKKRSTNGVLAPAFVIQVKNIQVGLLGTGGQGKSGANQPGSGKTKTMSDGSKGWQSSKIDAPPNSGIFSLRRQRYLPLGRRQPEFVSKHGDGRSRSVLDAIKADIDGKLAPHSAAHSEAPVQSRGVKTVPISILSDEDEADGPERVSPYDAKAGSSQSVRLEAPRAATRLREVEEGEVKASMDGLASASLTAPISPAEIASLRREWERGGERETERGARGMLDRSATDSQGTPYLFGTSAARSRSAGERERSAMGQGLKASVLGQYAAFHAPGEPDVSQSLPAVSLPDVDDHEQDTTVGSRGAEGDGVGTVAVRHEMRGAGGHAQHRGLPGARDTRGVRGEEEEEEDVEEDDEEEDGEDEEEMPAAVRGGNRREEGG
eukprot:2061304-Rhodomonas_salina.4